jgi:hypothetical protein
MSRLLALVLLAGCAPTTFAFSPTINGVRSKPDNCPVEVITSPPSRDFQEVGTLDFYNGTEPKTLDAFKQAVGKQVCQVGGDAVIAIQDDKGLFTKGRVLAYTDSGAPSTAPKGPQQQSDTELPK